MAKPTFAQIDDDENGWDLQKLLGVLVSGQFPDGTAYSQLVESSSTDKGDARAVSTTTATLLSALVTIPAGTTKVLLVPDATLTVSTKNTPSSSVGYRIPASTEWKYDGDSLATLKLYGAANVDCWFFA